MHSALITSTPHAEAVDEDAKTALRSYERDGFVVLQGLIEPDACDGVREAFTSEVRHSRVPILRQKNMQYERNLLDGDGYLTNPIFNVQDMERRRHGRFRTAALDVLTAPRVREATATLLRAELTRLIQSMFFEAPAGTWAHQDSYYQDSAAGLGRCVAGWFALQDVDEDAGRFWVCPGSHRAMAPIRNAGALSFAGGHLRYQQAVRAAMAEHGFQVVAPALRKGDVLFWNSLTIHGSFPGGRSGASRASLTAHYLHDADPLLQFHSRIRAQETISHNAMRVGLLHSQDRLRNRMLRTVACNLPRMYGAARRAALFALLARRRLARGAGNQTFSTDAR